MYLIELGVKRPYYTRFYLQPYEGVKGLYKLLLECAFYVKVKNGN